MDPTRAVQELKKIKTRARIKLHFLLSPLLIPLLYLTGIHKIPLARIGMYIELGVNILLFGGIYVGIYFLLHFYFVEHNKKVNQLAQRYIKEASRTFVPRSNLIHIYMDSITSYYDPQDGNNVNVEYYNAEGKLDEAEDIKIKKIRGDDIGISYLHIPKEIEQVLHSFQDYRRPTLHINESLYQKLKKDQEIIFIERVVEDAPPVEHETIQNTDTSYSNLPMFWKLFIPYLAITFILFMFYIFFIDDTTLFSFYFYFWMFSLFFGPAFFIGIHQFAVKRLLKRFMKNTFIAIIIHSIILTLLGLYIWNDYKDLLKDYSLLKKGEVAVVEGTVTGKVVIERLKGPTESSQSFYINGDEYFFPYQGLVEEGKTYRITYMPNSLHIIKFEELE